MMGRGEWGMNNGEWGMRNGEWIYRKEGRFGQKGEAHGFKLGENSLRSRTIL